MGNYLQVAIPGGNVVSEARGRVRSWYGDNINIPNSAACKSAGSVINFLSRQGRKSALEPRKAKR